MVFLNFRERSGSVVECLTRDGGAAGSSLTDITALWSLSKTHSPSLVLVQPRKTHSSLTERLLMGHKESNQRNKQSINQFGTRSSLGKSVYQKSNFLTSRPKHMLRVFKRTVSMRRFF